MLRLILDGIEKNEKAITELKGSVDRGMVGRDNCDFFRREFNARLTKVEEVCGAYQATKGFLVDGADLGSAKADAIYQAGLKNDTLAEEIKEIKASISVIQEYPRLVSITWNLIWGNPVLRWLTIGLFGGAYVGALGAIGVYWGRIGQYGWHIVGAVLVTILLISIGVVLSRRNNRQATKEAGKKIMGIQ